jgi:hypothetical protein
MIDSDSKFRGRFASKLAEAIRLGPWEFHENCTAKIQILMESMSHKWKNDERLVVLGEIQASRQTAPARIESRKPRQSLLPAIP